MTNTGPSADSSALVRRQVRLSVGVVLVLVGAGLAVYALATWLGDDGETVGVPGATSAPGSVAADDPGASGAADDPAAGADEGDDEGDDGGTGNGVGEERILPEGFGEAMVTITAADGETCEVCVLTATTSAARSQGLMDVSDPGLGGYDGMLFEYDDETSGSFWMRNTLLDLSIAWFDGDGTLVSTADMEPCPDDVANADCPRYAPDGAYRSALEVPQGELQDLLVADGSSLRIDARTCPGAVAAA
ncbi:hypothetical protein BH23ACT2_BH23ACT2_05560 [soil metagenome]